MTDEARPIRQFIQPGDKLTALESLAWVLSRDVWGLTRAADELAEYIARGKQP